MATEIRPQATPLTLTPLGDDLAENAPCYDFFQAVTLLERFMPEARPVGGFSNPGDEAVHFHVNHRLGFPASKIQQLEFHDGRPAEMMVNFMGLTGPMGVLPYTYSELMLERIRAKDHSMAAFFDIFNHRAISLFYRAWQKPRFPVTYNAGSRDFFTRYLRDLIGIGTEGLENRQEIEDEGLIHYISLLGMQTRSAAALEQIIADYFQVPVEIEQFAGGWYSLEETIQCSMEEDEDASCQLGGGAVVGDAVWDRQGRVRIRVGPLNLKRYNEFLPGGSAFNSLRALTRFFSNQSLDFELQLVLDRNEAPGTQLDTEAEEAPRLGWISWVKNTPLRENLDDTILSL